MRFSRKHHAVGLIANIVVFLCALVGLIYLVFDPIIPDKSTIMCYFTTLSNIFVALTSFINIILYSVSISKNKNCVKEFFQVLKLISVVCVAITFTIVIIFLAPATNDPAFLFSGSQLFLHVITPIAAVFSFIFLEYQVRIRFRFFFTPIIALVLYGAFYIPYAFLAPAGTLVDWYGFLLPANGRIAPVDPSTITWAQTFIFLGESLGGSLVFGLLFWLLNKIAGLIFVGYEYKPEEEYYDEVATPEEIAEEETKEENEVEKVEETSTKEKKTTASSKKKVAPAKAKVTSAPKKYKDGARVYHIARSKFVSRSWQVKLAGGEKAIKIFPTQAEAISFAKELVKTQGGSIRIHSMKGQLRK